MDKNTVISPQARGFIPHDKQQATLFPFKSIKKRSGITEPFEEKKVRRSLDRAMLGFEKDVSADLIMQELARIIYDDIFTKDLSKALVYAAAAFIERDPAYNYVAARLFLQHMYKEVKGKAVSSGKIKELYQQKFLEGIQRGIALNLLDHRLNDFDLKKLSAALVVERDNLFG